MNYSQWDWNVGKKVIADLSHWYNAFEWIEEPYVSPDGEKIAAIVKTGEMTFSVCENGVAWERSFDKIWYLRFAPDNRAVALVSEDAMWTVAVSGQAWENGYGFVWDTRFSKSGDHITVAAQSEGNYFAVTDDSAWQHHYPSLSNLIVSDDGKNVAAVVQSAQFITADIFAFQQGCYTPAVNGKTWDKNFVNVFEMNFSPDGQHLAAEVRTTLYDYTIAVDGQPWDKIFASVWKPKFNPVDNSATAPVKVPGGWTLACNGEIVWDGRYLQLWHHQYSADGKTIAAIVAPKYGQQTVAVNDKPWRLTFNNLVTDLVVSPDGKRAACAARSDGKWAIAEDGKCWDESFDMAWAPVFSPDSRHIASKVEKNGRFYIFIDGKPIKYNFEAAWNPVFSPDGDKVLVKGIGGENKGQYCRYVFKLSELLV